MKIYRWNKPIERSSGDERTTQQRRPQPIVTPEKPENLSHEPDICPDAPADWIDTIAVLFKEITRDGITVVRRQKQPKHGIRRSRRPGARHTDPFSGHLKPVHNLSTVARA